jgi:hypothetical protein
MSWRCHPFGLPLPAACRGRLTGWVGGWAVARGGASSPSSSGTSERGAMAARSWSESSHQAWSACLRSSRIRSEAGCRGRACRGTWWPRRCSARISGMPSSAIQVLWPCLSPCPVRPGGGKPAGEGCVVAEGRPGPAGLAAHSCGTRPAAAPRRPVGPASGTGTRGLSTGPMAWPPGPGRRPPGRGRTRRTGPARPASPRSLSLKSDSYRSRSRVCTQIASNSATASGGRARAAPAMFSRR